MIAKTALVIATVAALTCGRRRLRGETTAEFAEWRGLARSRSRCCPSKRR